MTLLGSLPVSGQVWKSSRGKEFNFGFLEASSSTNVKVCISGKPGTQVDIKAPKGTFTRSLNIDPDGTSCTDLPTTFNVQGSGIKNLGLSLTATDSVQVYLWNGYSGVNDASPVYPKGALGTRYYVLSYAGATGSSEFLVVASEDSTQVQINSTVTTGGFSAGVPQSIILHKGDVFQLKASAPGDLTGSEIKASKRVAVYAGNDAVLVGGCLAGDHLNHQMHPVNTWGKEFLTTPYITRTVPNLFRVIAAENNTLVYLDGAQVATLNMGQWTEIPARASHIKADKPVTVAQIAQGGYCDGNIYADPTMVILNPMERMSRYPTSVLFELPSPAVAYYKYVNIITKTAHTGQIKVNGTAPTESWMAYPLKMDYSYIQISLAAVSRVLIESDSGFFATGYGYGVSNAVSYAFNTHSLFLFPDEQPCALIANAGGDHKLCIGDTVTLSGSGGNTFQWMPHTNLSAPNSAKTLAWPDTTTTYTLYVYDQNACVDSDRTTLFVSYGPRSTFTWTRKGTEVQFFGTDEEGIYAWEWDFGDRSTPSSLQNPTHSYVQEDTFTVCLTVWDSCGKHTNCAKVGIMVSGTDSGKTGVKRPSQVGSVHIFPNPASNYLIATGLPVQGYMELTDLSGRLLRGISWSGSTSIKLSLETTYLGMAQLRIQGQEGVQNHRVWLEGTQ